jgi:16S rRNA (uracil1498-N3)-methyltransferase
MARFFVPRENVRDRRGVITGQELSHLRTVLRLATGDHITVFDDAGREHEAVIGKLSADSGEFEIVRSWTAATESALRIILGAGLTKGGKMDLVVEKATELGVHAIVPFFSEFSVPNWDERKIAARTARWNKVAHSAVKQCGRTRSPEILPLRNFQALVSGDWSDALKLFFYEKERAQSLRDIRKKCEETRTVVIAVGAEGGFSEAEALLATLHRFEPVHLGPRILRAETAAITALSLVQFLWGDGT